MIRVLWDSFCNIIIKVFAMVRFSTECLYLLGEPLIDTRGCLLCPKTIATSDLSLDSQAECHMTKITVYVRSFSDASLFFQGL